ncbi:unnamed protein product, partial [Gordionus sp. m RMFG-2023]
TTSSKTIYFQFTHLNLEDTENQEQIPTQDTIQQNQTMERFILPKSKEGIIASTREKARKRQALCRIKKRNEQSLIPTTSNHLEDTGNKQFASTSNHLEDTENQEQIPTQDTFGAISKYNFFSDPISIKTNQVKNFNL